MNVVVARATDFGRAALRAFQDGCAGLAAPAAGLATGRTPTPLYQALAAAVRDGKADVRAVRPFAIDEYGGPPGHPCSNRAYFQRYWETIPGAAPVAQFDVAAADPTNETRRFAGALAEAGGLDVVVLGIGMNGHLAFNEPGTPREGGAAWVPLAERTRASARACWAEETPRFGMTLGLAELLGARRALLLANGAAKAAIVRRALAGPVGADCPASFLQAHGALTVVLDEAAASQLPPGFAARPS
jgi:glucosamine-6-phosphate deaminase